MSLKSILDRLTGRQPEGGVGGATNVEAPAAAPEAAPADTAPPENEVGAGAWPPAPPETPAEAVHGPPEQTVGSQPGGAQEEESEASA